MTAFCCRGKLIKVYGQKNDQKQGKMKGRKKILLLALFAVATLVFRLVPRHRQITTFLSAVS